MDAFQGDVWVWGGLRKRLLSQTRGWLRLIRHTRQAQKQVPYYARFAHVLTFYADWIILPFDEAAATKFDSLRNEGLRIGTMDLKIAAVALVHDATLLTSNLKDFKKVPDLRVEDWLKN